MRGSWPIVVVLLLGGCSMGGLSKYASKIPETPVTVAEIQRAVACEFAYALASTDGDGQAAIRDWSAVVELTLGVKDLHNVTPGLGQMSAKIGNATIATASPAPSMTFDGSIEDKNTLAYVGKIEEQATKTSCPPQGSNQASSGLGLADLLVGTAQVINSGGSIASSTTIITSTGIGPADGAVVSSGTVLPVAAVREAIPTVKYERNFSVSRKAGGGLTFKVGSVSLSLTGSATGRERKDNKIVVTMGPSRKKLPTNASPTAFATASGGVISLEDSIFQSRTDQIDAIKGLTPNEVIVVVPPTP